MRCVTFFTSLCAGMLLLGQAAAAKPLVAVIDSGVARTPELASVLVSEYDMAVESPRPAFQPRYDHGTQISTVLNREAKGQVNIVSIRIDQPSGCAKGLNPPCQRDAKVIARAIYQAMRLNVDAINMSLALQDDQAIIKAVYYATRQGILVVMAAGNDGLDQPGNLRIAKAGMPRTVLVGATDASGAVWRKTNRPEPGPALPYNYAWQLGVDVPTMNADGSESRATGTSLSAPIETARRMTRTSTAVDVAALGVPLMLKRRG